MNRQLLGRREFNGLCAALGLSLPAASAMIAAFSNASTQTAIGEASNDADVRLSSRTAPLSQRSARALGISHREDIQKLSRSKHCAPALRSA